MTSDKETLFLACVSYRQYQSTRANHSFISVLITAQFSGSEIKLLEVIWLMWQNTPNISSFQADYFNIQIRNGRQVHWNWSNPSQRK